MYVSVANSKLWTLLKNNEKKKQDKGERKLLTLHFPIHACESYWKIES